ncbi:MAG TPA: ATP-binding protein [bacterium]|nr:ATP-binding protein [bacterium]
MLIEFKVKNYLSFKEETVLSMVASNDKQTLPQNVIEPSGTFKHRLLKSAVIYGANASGKSNFLSALSFVESFVRNSTNGDNETIIGIEPFAFDSDCSNKPSTFELDFIQDGTRYIYGFSADKRMVHNEWLYHFPRGQQALLFERSANENFEQLYKFTREQKKRLSELSRNTRQNSLFLTVATQLNVDFAKKVNSWFSSFRQLPLITSSSPFFTSDLFSKNKDIKDMVLSFLKKADLEIDDIVYVKKEKEIDKKADFLLQELFSMIDPSGKKMPTISSTTSGTFIEYDLWFVHKTINSSGEEQRTQIRFDRESSGTQRFYEIAGYIILTILDNLTIFSDEIDLRLHPRLIAWMIDLFHKFKEKATSQLIFTTHNTELLSPELMRRDQIWFVEKNRSTNASHLFSLADFKHVRKEENFRKNYLDGRYGAVPILQKFDIYDDTEK